MLICSFTNVHASVNMGLNNEQHIGQVLQTPIDRSALVAVHTTYCNTITIIQKTVKLSSEVCQNNEHGQR